jgi:transcriptional regulator with XRE-family HTH domain
MRETMGAGTTAGRLQQARLAAGLQLSDIEQRTRISPSVLRWIDAGQFHRLPAGIYARCYVRAFAQAVGLDPNEVIASLEHELPAAADISPTPAVRPQRSLPLSPELLRIGAASADAALLSVLYGVVLGVTAAVCRLPVGEVLVFGMPAVALVLGLITAIYFVVFAGIQGQTPGARLVGLPALDVSGPARLNVIIARAIHVFVSEASLGIDIASRRSVSPDVRAAAPYGSRSTP